MQTAYPSLWSVPLAAGAGEASLEQVWSSWAAWGTRASAALRRAARHTLDHYGGVLPGMLRIETLPRVGPAPAAGVAAFAWGA